jgi:hypothetical protein
MEEKREMEVYGLVKGRQRRVQACQRCRWMTIHWPGVGFAA